MYRKRIAVDLAKDVFQISETMAGKIVLLTTCKFPIFF